MYKSPYTISIWDTSTSPETKICDIGSNTMTTSARALEPKLQRNINGKMSFSFKTYKDCYDEDRGKFSNPYLPYLVNERVVKVNWENEWFDFIIKNVQEDSAAKSYTFQCESWLVQELSKQGFNLEFDEKLGNGQGFIDDLAQEILKNTNWIADESNEAIGLEYNKEAVYEVNFSSTAFNALHLPEFTYASISGGKGLIFFSCIGSLGTTPGQTILQFVWTGSTDPVREPNSMMVKDSEQYNYQVAATYTYSNGAYTFTVPAASSGNVTFSVSIPMGTSSTYRAKKLINSIKSVYDPITDKYCYVLYERNTTNDQLYTTNGDPLYIQLNGQLYPIYVVGTSSASGQSEYYEYQDTQSNFAKYVQNLIANPMGFTDSTGWRKVTSTGGATPTYTQDELVPYVDAKKVKSYLFIPATTGSTTTDWIFNMSIRSSRNFVQRFIYGENYILRMKVESKAQGASSYSAVSPPFTQIKIAKYLSSDNYYPSDAANETYFEVPSGGLWTQDGSTGYYYIRLNCINGLSLESVSDAKIGLYFKNDTISDGYPKIRIEEAQLFKEIRTDDGSDFIRPAEFDAAGVLKTQYYLYDNTAAKAQGFTSKDQIIPLYCDDDMISTDDTRYKYITTEFKKFRTITGKESNRFNLLQSLAEKFECWCVIYANHSANGTITSRHVKFVETVGEDQNIGFIYGLDLKGIKRTVDSKQIVTKTIVKANSNKYGENGFATIARAQENYPKVNYVLDFDYYVNQGLLDNSTLNQALYSVATDTSYMPGTSQQWPANTPVGYYQKLHKFNTAYDNAANSYEKYKLQYDNLGAYLKVFEEYRENASTEKYGYMLSLFNLGKFVPSDKYDSTEMENTLNQYWTWATASAPPATGTDARKVYDWYQTNVVTSRAQDGLRDQAAVTAWKYSDAIVAAITNEDKYIDQIASISDTIDELADNIEDAEDEMEAQVTLIHAADLQFQQSYGQFIQEGTWSSEDYHNDTLYYLDALDVAYTSARPRITYTIDVLKLDALPEFQAKVFELGDIAYIEDTEFFGYTTVNGVKTPYHEKVVLTELTQNFDDPSKDQFKVQNYRMQFEDLFQRITATVQTVQWNEADYARAVDAVEKDETINTDILQSSFNNAQNLVRNSLNNAIVQDATGISIINQNDPVNQSHINAEGFFISTDGGTTWRNAVSAEGIATELLTAGAIDTSRISVKDGNWEAFRWDNTGLNAYMSTSNGWGDIEYGTFVRFDKWGIYGRNSSDVSYTPTSEEDIWSSIKTKFALTWSGLEVTSSSGTSSIIVGDDPIAPAPTGHTGIRITQNYLDVDAYGETRVRDREDVFWADTNGNLHLKGNLEAATGSFSGTITASGGLIGGFIINSDELVFQSQLTGVYSGMTTFEDYFGKEVIFFAGLDENDYDHGGISEAPFRVTSDGYLYAENAYIRGDIVTSGLEVRSGSSSSAPYLFYADSNTYQVQIGGWNVNAYTLQTVVNTGSTILASGMANGNADQAGTVFYAGVDGQDAEDGYYDLGTFWVGIDGELHASNANISGIITATDGSIGGFTIDSTSIYNGNPNPSAISGVGMSKAAGRYAFWSVGATGTFTVGSNGVLTCTGASIGGTLDGATGTFAGSLTAQSLQTQGVTIAREIYAQQYSGATFTPWDGTSYNSSFAIRMDSLGWRPVKDATINLGSSNNRWLTVYARTSSINTSSRKHKTDIQDIDIKYETFFDNLKPRSFLMSGSTSIRRNTGFVLDEVGTALQEANMTGMDFAGYCLNDPNDPLGDGGLRYEEFIAINTWQVQKLKKRIDQLEAQLQQLQL